MMRDITKMDIIGRVTTIPIKYETFDAQNNMIGEYELPRETYDVVDIFEENGRKYYVTNVWYKEYKNQPVIIVENIVEEYESLMKSGGYVRLSKTPAPKSERIYGSQANRPKSSSSSASASSITFSEDTLDKIKNKISEHNDKHPNKKVSLAVAKAVVRRGMGAYSSTHRPTITGGRPNSRVAWGLARLNAFLYKIVHGTSKSGRYSQDNDLINELGYRVRKFDDGGDIDRMEEGGYLHGSPNDFCDTGFKLGAGKGQGENLWGVGHYFTDDKDLATYYAKFIKSEDVTNQLEQKVADKLGFKTYNDIPYDYEKKGIKTKYGEHLKLDLYHQYLKQYVDKNKDNGIVYEVTLFPGKDKKDYKIIDFSGENYADKEVIKRDKKDLKNLIDTLSKNKRTYAKAVKLFFDKKGWEFSLEKYNERFADVVKTMRDYYNNFESYSASTPLLYSLGYDIKKLFKPDYFNFATDYKIILDKLKTQTDQEISDFNDEVNYYKGVLFTEFIKDAGYDALKYYFSPSIIPYKDDSEHGANAIVVFDDENVEIDNCKVAANGDIINTKYSVTYEDESGDTSSEWFYASNEEDAIRQLKEDNWDVKRIILVRKIA